MFGHEDNICAGLLPVSLVTDDVTVSWLTGQWTPAVKQSSEQLALVSVLQQDKLLGFLQKMMEAKIMREMEDTKETLQRSKKLLSGR